MQYIPPPLFKQGAPARVKVIFFSLIAIILLVVDARLHALQWMRQAIGSVLYPVQMLALMPRDAAEHAGEYFSQLSVLKKENADLKRTQLTQAFEVQQTRQLQEENVRLRQLLTASQSFAVKSVLASVLYDARNSFSRRVILDRGMSHGIAPGQPVMDDLGVVGQVTQVFPFTAEVTLLTDKDQAIPVQVQRNGLRSVIYGKGQIGNLELRLPAGADIKADDILITSGIDGIYPAGLQVARVKQIENNAASVFERVICLPLAGLDRHKEVLILLFDHPVEARPVDDKESNKLPKVNRRITRDFAEERATKEVPEVQP